MAEVEREGGEEGRNRAGRSLFAFFTTANANNARIRSPFARLPAQARQDRVGGRRFYLTVTAQK